MISGVIPVVNAKGMGIPYLQSIQSWADVCDEIVIVTTPGDPGLQDMYALIEKLKGKCDVKVRGITRPKDFEVYRILAYPFISEPGWVVHFDGDYLISPYEANILRSAILAAPEDTDIITYVLAYLNYDATMTFKTKEMKKWWPPHDGFRAEFPFVLNISRGMFISPYEGQTERGNYVNMEGVMSFNPKNWGLSFNTKFMNHNPHGFNIIRSGVTVEHLTWSMKLKRAQRKANEQNHVGGGVGWDKVRNGDEPWPASYPLLEEARAMYRVTE